MTTDPNQLDWLTRDRPTVLVVLTSPRELRRFVLSGAFDELGRDRRLHYVLPAEGADDLLSQAGPLLTPAECSTVTVPPGRVECWEGVSGTQPLDAIVDLFDEHMPLYCIVPSSVDDGLGQEVLWACEVEDVSCLVLQTEWTDFAERRRIHRRGPFVGCWGRQSQEHAKTIQHLGRQTLEALGAPHYERLQRLSPAERQQIRARAGVADGQRMILVVDLPAIERGSPLDELERAVVDGHFGAATVVRHDSSASDELESFRVAAACDAVIAPVSSVLVAALILEKPTMALAFAGTGGMDAELRDSGALVWCERADRLIADGRRLFQPVDDEETARKARRLLVNRVVTRQPGTYAERLAEFCRSSIDNQARKERARRTGAKRHTNSNSYGALLVALTHSGIAHSETITVPGHWMHGWLPAYHSLDPMLIAYHKLPGQGEGYDFEAQIEREREDTPQWVSRADQAEYLIAHGYRHVKAIGLPIAYVPKPEVPRLPGSLLVMPPHGHRDHGPDDSLAEGYAEAIAAIAHRFTCVHVGISEDDVAKQQWIESFRRRSISVFTTADGGDPNTLVRLRRILSTFEYVTTNGFGSQIAFAAYCGAKVSVYGPFAEFPRERLRTTHVVKMFPRFLETVWSLCTEDALRRHYPFLFVEPDRAVVREEWGAHEVGKPWTVAPHELRRLFGWESAPGQMSLAPALGMAARIGS